MDNDDLVRADARATLDELWKKYWTAKQATNPPTSYDDYYDLRTAYEDAAVEYAGLEGRLLADDILSRTDDVASFRQVRDDMAAARQVRETVAVATRFIGLVAKLV